MADRTTRAEDRIDSRASHGSVRIVKRDDLPWSDIAHELVGAEHGDVSFSVIFVDAPPGRGPALHKHPYEELFITLEGSATFVARGERLEVGPGDVVIVPADTPHTFTNTGDGQLRQIDIHASPTFTTEWLEQRSPKSTAEGR